MSSELAREMNGLKSQSIPPYYMDYRVDQLNTVNLNTSFGSLVGDNENDGKILTTSVRVGNYQFDNTHEISSIEGNASQPFTMKIPVENVPDAIKVTLWEATHYAYRSAVDNFNQVQSGLKDDNKAYKYADYSIEKPSQYFEPAIDLSFKNKNKWISDLKEYSKSFLDNEDVVDADAILTYFADRKYFVSSEGSKIVQNNCFSQLQINVSLKTSDGSVSSLYKSYYSFSPDSLPSRDEVLNDIAKLKQQLKALKNAPQADPYSGPAIMAPGAAAVFFHEIFGHRIEGQRLRSFDDSQTFKAKIGEKVLPKYMSIYSDPTLKYFKNQDMYGYYKYDDQGIPAQRVTVVQKGVLENFLMSRSPIDGFSKSNGHGRSQVGMAPVSRQSNLIVETSKPCSSKELRKKLMKECKKEKKPYGYLFDQVTGGFTLTSRFQPNVFNVKPTVVYRIYVDGRPDELVRGVDFIGTPLAIFSQIGATGDSTAVFTGYCGAESGNIPVTAVSPALFIKNIETQKQPEGIFPKPILPRPDVEKIQNKIQNN
jgi:TldD protein